MQFGVPPTLLFIVVECLEFRVQLLNYFGSIWRGEGKKLVTGNLACMKC
jgi:hypothetical protein